MRRLAAVGALSVLVLGAPEALALPRNPAILHLGGHTQALRSPLQQRSSQLLKAQAFGQHATRPQGASNNQVVLSALEADIVSRINGQRTVRRLRPLRVSRGLTAAANYHSRQMGLFGFFG